MGEFMKKLKMWHRVLIIVVLLSVLFELAEYSLNFFGSLLAFIVVVLLLAFIILCIKYKAPKQEKPKAVKQSAPAKPDKKSKVDVDEAKRKWEEKHAQFETRVAGVTFRNDDGTSRQKYLKQAYNSDDVFDVDLESYEYEGKPAIRVLLEGNCVGNIPANNVDEVLEYMKCLTDVDIYPDCFTDEETGKDVYRADLVITYKKD